MRCHVLLSISDLTIKALVIRHEMSDLREQDVLNYLCNDCTVQRLELVRSIYEINA